MRSSALQLVFDIVVLVACLVIEELAPKFGGIGLPVLLTAVATLAVDRPLVLATMFALAAGGAEDASSSLPMMLSSSYFLGIALWARCRQLPMVLWVLMYPGYQLWLGIWTSGIGGGIFYRLLMSLVLGTVTMLVMPGVLRFCERKAGIDEV